jgi:hypothetical protein
LKRGTVGDAAPHHDIPGKGKRLFLDTCKPSDLEPHERDAAEMVPAGMVFDDGANPFDQTHLVHDAPPAPLPAQDDRAGHWAGAQEQGHKTALWQKTASHFAANRLSMAA